MKVCCQVQGEPVRRAKEGERVLWVQEVQGEGGGFAALLDDDILVSQPPLRVMLLS